MKKGISTSCHPYHIAIKAIIPVSATQKHNPRSSGSFMSLRLYVKAPVTPIRLIVLMTFTKFCIIVTISPNQIPCSKSLPTASQT